MRPLWAGALLALASFCAHAQDGAPLTGTLKTIAQRGTIRVGVRADAIPFAFRNKAGEPIGFSVDLCREIALDVAALLHRDLLEPAAPAWQTGLRLQFIDIAADARLPGILSGAIDLECGSTTANAERSKLVAFSPVFFLAGTKLLAPLPRPTSYRDFAGRRVAVGVGTTNAAVMRRLGGSVSPPIVIVEAPSLNEAYDMLTAGKVDAIASDDILLAGLTATHPDRPGVAIIGDFLSYEPYAIVLPRDDPAFADLVRHAFERMAADGILTTRYRRWFIDRLPGGQTLDLPISAQLTEMYRALGQPD
jgi:glutamate/aspartate transport system substrate-binding protein